VQWPEAVYASDASSAFRERLIKAAIVFAMLALTVFDRFGLRVTAASSIPVGMMAMYVVGAAIILAGPAHLNRRAGLAYLAIVTVAALSFVLNAAFSPPPFTSKMSFLLLILLYAPLFVALRRGAVAPELWRWTVNVFVGFCLFLAAAGITQYFAQFVFHPEWLFDFTPLIPERLQASAGWIEKYVVYSPAGEAQWVKSNGFFMREPSIFSVVMALGLLCELSLNRRRWVMAIIAVGLVLSHAASGLVCLAAGLLFPLGRGTLARVIALTVLAAGVVLLLGDTLNVQHFINRADEFTVANSSAYCRFVYPSIATLQQMDSNAWAALLGHGPGSMERMGATCFRHQPTFAKALFEYGLLGSLAFAVLILDALNRSSAPVRIRVAMGVAWLGLGGNLLDPSYLLFIYIVSAIWPQDTARTLAISPRPQRKTWRSGVSR
jgi:hypothetical protein